MLSIPYRDAPHKPYWGEINAAQNFCEEVLDIWITPQVAKAHDFIITTYIAEFINTLTNLTYVYYAYKGIRGNSNRQDAILRNLPYLGLAGYADTNTGDDTSMLIATSTVLHRVFTYDKSLKYTIVYGCSLFVFMTCFIAWHCITDELVMHSVLFGTGIEIAIIGLKTRSIINFRVADVAVQRQVKTLVTYGGAYNERYLDDPLAHKPTVIFVSGFILWNIDNSICSTLTATKRSLGMPWSFLLELHGWWHIFTGIGAYIFIALVEYLTSEEAGQQLGPHFAWPVGVILDGWGGGKTRGGKMNGYAEGKGDGKKEL
ncbi:alkaline phytoceramidase protein [Rutstroemia sp. NJR-2017a WRK4]|nr:alkaline phytoceramidase protein [Rutstroemia sp. NJR-2017a WRK4]